MKKKNCILLILSLLSLNLEAAVDNTNPPNILCILVDDLGYGDLSCMGATDLRTPHIDKLAAEGMLFRSFYANSTVCSPSRAALLSGRYPDMVGVPGVIRQEEQNSWGYLDPSATLIPLELKKAGYHTAIIGKWHLGFEEPNRPNDRGFDLFKGFLGDMMEDYWTHLRGGVNWMRENEKEIDPRGHATDIFTDWAVDYFRERRGKGQPFFLYLAYNAPHFPIQPPPDYLERVLDREKGISEKRAKNVAFIEHLDDGVGKVLESLHTTGLAENTLIVFASDNGGALWHAQSNGSLRGGNQDTGDRSLFWVRREGFRFGGKAYYAARRDGYKLLQNTPFDPLEYFNIVEDYQEKKPLDPASSEEFYRLNLELQEHIRHSGRIPWQK